MGIPSQVHKFKEIEVKIVYLYNIKTINPDMAFPYIFSKIFLHTPRYIEIEPRALSFSNSISSRKKTRGNLSK